MTTMTNEEVRLASQRVMEHGIPEVPPEEFHKMIQAAWQMPADQGQRKEPLSGKPMAVGFIAGVLCFALGAGAGYWAATDALERGPIPPVGTSPYPGGDPGGVTDPFEPH